ncbi:5-formyltetrahydrofolate cyclo-ligase [Nocardioides sp. GY 10127]|uniref:5-formyltetrahydrofolate cyclo-ligase n=1 Tax=Nocardioides sp. GY 10127 TaxID=2569762 RepID=UPI0010A86DF7|nr:5-formyltetrahydrofolate cyclo-ligase [Nocardioides sp. GY 10127]TIC79094.1 5-formyltetrahydrofolate cyclo-ligase [Nocardioides sp. GY 10127]
MPGPQTPGGGNLPQGPGSGAGSGSVSGAGSGAGSGSVSGAGSGPVSGSFPGTVSGAAAKTAVRDRLLTARRRRTPLEQGEHAQSLAGVLLAAPEVARAATLACYVSSPGEPGTGPLLDALRAAGKRVLLPVLKRDMDLDWAPFTGATDLVGARFGLLEPSAPALGPEAVATADVVLVPGLAVSDAGARLGRGGGSYDRALARVPLGTPVWVLLHPEEVGVDVPTEPHDRPVTGAASGDGVVRLPR